MLRGILAVLGAYVAIVVVVMIGTAVATASLVPGGLGALRTSMEGGGPPTTSPGTGYLVVNVLVSVLAAMLGGWLVMRFAPEPRWQWAGILAAVVLLVGVAMASRGAQGGQPAWYPLAIAVLGAAGVMAGAWLNP